LSGLPATRDPEIEVIEGGTPILYSSKSMLAFPSMANAGATMHAANMAAEIVRSVIAQPFMRSLPRDKERSPQCSTPRA